MIRFACPTCQKVLQAPDERAGATLSCPGCKKPIQVPGAAAAKPPAPAGQAAVKTAPPAAAAIKAAPPPPAPAAPTGAEGWVYAKGGQRVGPVTWMHLQNLAASGELLPTDKVWTKGMPKPVDAKEVAGLFAEQPTVATADLTADGQPRPGFVKRVLVEIKDIGVATFIQNIRPMRFGLNLVRGRSLKRQATNTQLALGQKMYELQQGDKLLCKQIQHLGEQAHNVTANKAASKKALGDRKEAILKLAEPVLAQETPPQGADFEFQGAKAAGAKLATWKDQMKADRLVLFPGDKVAWRRVAIGGTLELCLALMVLILMWRPVVVPVTESVAMMFQPKMSSEEIYATHAKSVCLIKSEKSLGTGFLVKPGVIATNAHVIALDPIESYNVTFPSAGEAGKSPVKAKLLYYDIRRDLAFLQVDSKIEPLRVAKRYDFRPGQTICTIGCPAVGPKEHLENDIKTGVMSTKKPVKDMEFYQMSMAVNPGNSGGPVFDPYGQVIGVVTLKATRQEQTSFCIPLEAINEGLTKLSQQTPRQAEEMAAKHSVEMVFFRVSRSGKMYLEVMAGYIKLIRRAVELRIDHNALLRSARDSIMPKLNQIDRDLVDEIKPVMTKISADQAVPGDTRNKLVELWTTYQEVKDYVTTPRGTITEYEGKLNELTNKYNRVFEELRLALGIDKEDLEDH